MIDCPCGYGKGITEEKCNKCGTDLTPLHRLNSLPRFYYDKGIEFMKEDKLDEAIEQFTTAVTMDINFTPGYVASGKIYTGKKLYDKAIRDFEKALKLDSGNEEVKKEKIHAEEEKKKLLETEEKEKLLLEDTKKKLLETEENNKLLKKQINHYRGTGVLKNPFVLCILAVVFIISLSVVPVLQYFMKEKDVSSPDPIRNIRDKLSGYEAFQGLDIKIDYKDNVINIAGVVPTDLHKTLITDIIKTDAGNIKIETDNLSVKKEPLPSLNLLTSTIKQRLINSPVLSEFDLEVIPLDNSISISGEVPSEIHKNLIMEIADNIADKNLIISKDLLVTPSVASTDMTEPAATPTPGKEKITYVIQEGDTLTEIASRVYDDPQLWEKIYEANRDKITKPDVLVKGQVLIIPEE